jgi:hypothetical protein
MRLPPDFRPGRPPTAAVPVDARSLITLVALTAATPLALVAASYAAAALIAAVSFLAGAATIRVARELATRRPGEGTRAPIAGLDLRR